jgi:hypothetical protein
MLCYCWEWNMSKKLMMNLWFLSFGLPSFVKNCIIQEVFKGKRSLQIHANHYRKVFMKSIAQLWLHNWMLKCHSSSKLPSTWSITISTSLKYYGTKFNNTLTLDGCIFELIWHYIGSMHNNRYVGYLFSQV